MSVQGFAPLLPADDIITQYVPLERWKVFDYVSYQQDAPTEHYKTLYNGKFCVLSEHWCAINSKAKQMWKEA